MDEATFRHKFDFDRKLGALTVVTDGTKEGIAVGLKGPETIVLHGGELMAMSQARFRQ